MKKYYSTLHFHFEQHLHFYGYDSDFREKWPNGRCIMDEDLSDKMYMIKSYHPERADETSRGFVIYWGVKLKEVV